MNSEVIVDVRLIAPQDRHPLIFDAFENLTAGEGFVLVNDHDPKPLYYQFQADRTGQFTWDYLETGPDAWRVRVGRAEIGDSADLKTRHEWHELHELRPLIRVICVTCAEQRRSIRVENFA